MRIGSGRAPLITAGTSAWPSRSAAHFETALGIACVATARTLRLLRPQILTVGWSTGHLCLLSMPDGVVPHRRLKMSSMRTGARAQRVLARAQVVEETLRWLEEQGAGAWLDQGTEHPHRLALSVRADRLHDTYHRLSHAFSDRGLQVSCRICASGSALCYKPRHSTFIFHRALGASAPMPATRYWDACRLST